MQRDYPVFRQIKNIFVVNTNQVYFQVNKLDTMEFNTHRHMYIVNPSASLQVLDVDTLYCSMTLHIRKVTLHGHRHLGIVTKHHILRCIQD